MPQEHNLDKEDKDGPDNKINKVLKLPNKYKLPPLHKQLLHKHKPLPLLMPPPLLPVKRREIPEDVVQLEQTQMHKEPQHLLKDNKVPLPLLLLPKPLPPFSLLKVNKVPLLLLLLEVLLVVVDVVVVAVVAVVDVVPDLKVDKDKLLLPHKLQLLPLTEGRVSVRPQFRICLQKGLFLNSLC